MDIVFALAGIVLVTPLMVCCATWVYLVDRGPIVYRQWRVGRDGWLFAILKLRTMRCDAERHSGPRYARKGDARILPGCGWMRRAHVDELPQLWNILVGQMSLVGPRPERPHMTRLLCEQLPDFQERLEAMPGLTGLAQVRNGYTNDLAGARIKLANDLRYLRRRSVLFDLQLVARTLPKVWDRAAV